MQMCMHAGVQVYKGKYMKRYLHEQVCKHTGTGIQEFRCAFVQACWYTGCKYLVI